MEVGNVVGSVRRDAITASKEAPDDFETFLRMLTTQIQNQDPLSPMEAEEFASQLASFTMVEQQTLANQKLSVLVEEITNGEPFGASNLLGREVLHADAFEYSGGAVSFEVDPYDLGDDVKLRILNSEGAVVGEVATLAGSLKPSWDGLDLENLAVSSGVLTAELWRVSENQKLDHPVYTAATVEEVRFGDGEPQLLLSDGTVIPESGVSKLREAPQ